MQPIQPPKKCDLVMKGGVTSGVVYPKAITELSTEYTFCNIGGTSAGAIAASVAAAAEYARAGGNLQAFGEVDKLPGLLSAPSTTDKHSRLFHLFQPQAQFKGLYGIAMAALGRSGARRWAAILMAALKAFPLLAIAGLLPGIVFGWIAFRVSEAWLHWTGLMLAVLLGIAGIGLGLVAGIVWQIRSMPRAKWGICSGMTEAGATDPALVPWLAQYLDQIAGKGAGEPLTFGDLQSRDVSLEVISTNLTTGRPYRLPFDKHSHFYFKPDELKKFFPDYVVEWMREHPGTRSTRDVHREVASAGLCVMPDAAMMPVIVAVRMSLSFPFLFCPVPFYAVDFGYGPTDAAGKHLPEPCFFADGGLTSNFPLTLFDQALARWPTFGINLRNRNDGRHNQAIYMVSNNSGGLEEWWSRFDERRGLSGLFSYFGLLFDTSRNWRDNLQMSVPGYRDRVVHIGLDPKKEGGLNLDMNQETIQSLVEDGADAGAAILSRYAPSPRNPPHPHCDVNLNNQKWIRLRSLMALLEDVLLAMDDATHYSGNGERTYDDLLRTPPAPSYQMPATQRDYAGRLFGDLMQLVPEIRKHREMGQSFATHAPKPEPEFRVIPRY
jgi:predicted acylesterase/phospholipase RssA